MKLSILSMIGLAALCAIAGPETATAKYQKGAIEPQSMGTLAFSPEGVLFIGDSMGATIYAVQLGDPSVGEDAKELSIQDVERKVAALLGADAEEVLIHDMAVNPRSQNVYFTVSRGREKWDSEWKLPNDIDNASVLLRLTPAGKFEEVSLNEVEYLSTPLPKPIDASASHQWKKTSMRVDAITDMAYQDGKLYVAGLSNEEFASALRVIPFPFDGKATTTTLEIYHGAHGKYETNAPIRTLLPYSNKGKPHILAAYLCTPLVTFPADEIVDEKHVRGMTLAELGFGNYPLDMVSFKSGEKDFVMLTNSTRELMIFDMAQLAAVEKGLDQPVESVRAGVDFYRSYGMPGVQQMDNYNDQFILVLKRMANGKLDLRSLPKRRI